MGLIGGFQNRVLKQLKRLQQNLIRWRLLLLRMKFFLKLILSLRKTEKKTLLWALINK
jgi:hypothetical protein